MSDEILITVTDDADISVQVADLGEPGLDGKTVLTGLGAPSASDGKEGDFWLDRSFMEMYGPKAGTSWGTPVSIIGPPGPPGSPGPVGPSTLNYRGAWDSGTAYATNDWVTFGGETWVAIAPSTNFRPDLFPAKWVVLSIESPPGPQGEPGPVGPTGSAGPTGPAGADGAAGAQGPAGATGATGPAGAAGATGPTGATGEAGPEGIQGIQGEKGNQGDVGPAILTFKGEWNSGTTYIVNDWVSYIGTAYFAKLGSLNVPPSSDPTKWALLTVSGPQGPQGIQGIQGATGPTGPTGAAGPTGPQGATGATGSTGATGPAGIQGVAGPSGPSGAGALTGRLAVAASNAVLTIDVVANDEWPVIPTQVTTFHVLVDNELMLVTGTSVLDSQTKRFTVTRAQFGTTATSHNKNSVVALRALIGPQGPVGAQGIQGIQGIQGNTGATGSTGSTGATGTLPGRGNVGLTTASLANAAIETGTIAIGKSGEMVKIVASHFCRVQLYKNAAARTADATRAIGTDPLLEAGVICDLVFDAIVGLTLDVQAFGWSNTESSPSANIPYRVQNLNGNTQAITVTFTRLERES